MSGNGDPLTCPVEPIIVFQPVIDLVTGVAVGYEALSRLNGNEEAGFPALESAARQLKCLSATLRQAQALALSISKNRPSGTALFLNVTKSCLNDLKHVTDLDECAWRNIVLEIPEHQRKTEDWGSVLAPFRALGAQVALDDWGVGEADPLRMIRLKPNWLKIDQAIVSQVGLDTDADQLIEALVEWSEVRGVGLIAEGCENMAQIERLRALGVRYGQGFGLARPNRAWVAAIDLSTPGTRLGQLHGTALAFSHAVELTDDKLQETEREQRHLHVIVEKAVSHTMKWIRRSAAGTHLDDKMTRERYEQALVHHFDTLTRGYLSVEDIDRAHAVARTHQRLGLDLSWYIMSYRELQACVAQQLRSEGKVELAEAARALFSWDMALTMEAYQRLLDRDALTGVLTRAAFWNRAKFLVSKGLTHNRAWAFVLIDVEEFKKINDNQGHVAGDIILQQIGQVLLEFMSPHFLASRLGGDEFVLFFAYQNSSNLDKTLQSVRWAVKNLTNGIELSVGVSILGRDGLSLDALYQVADLQMYSIRNRGKRSGK